MTTLGTCHFVPPYLLQELARTGTLDPAYVDGCLRIDLEMRASRPGPAAPPGTGVRWTVHSAGNTERLPGDPVRREGDPESGDETVDEAATGITATLDLFRDVYARDSFDGAGAPVLVTVHYGERYANAFWDGRHLVFGDGDGKVFRGFTRSVDVVAHEFGHAVTERTAGLAYQGQSGALNESVSDVYAACLKQRLHGDSPDEGSWLIGEGIFVDGINARGLRDMEAPGTAYDDPVLGRDPQPAHMDDFVVTTDDNGGVHINSGIPNRAFVLAARAVGGTSAEGAGRIWYAALTGGLIRATTDFAGFAAATVAAAGEHASAVAEAWSQVGVGAAALGEASVSGSAGAQSAPAVVVVRRSGGLLGIPVEGSLDLDAETDDRAAEVRDLVARVDLRTLAGGSPQPDRYTFDFDLGGSRATVPEDRLTPELRRIADLVLAARWG